MPNPDDAVSLLQSALEAELAYKQSVCAEPDPTVYQSARNHLLSHYVPEGAEWHEARIERADFRPDPGLAERFRVRDLFQVRFYTHAEHGMLALGYAGETSTALPPPFSSGYKYLYVMRVHEGQWAICGHYTPCFVCMCLGTQPADQTCANCNGLGWEHLVGLEVTTWETATGRIALNPPREPAPHQTEYERE